MDLLFKREQTSSRILKVTFKLWGKIELTEEEQALIKRYSLGDACLIEDFQPRLLRNAASIGLLAFVVAFIVLSFLPDSLTWLLAFVAGGGAGYWFYQKRETIFVKDLLHGRYFACRSIIDLARKEAWLEDRVAVFRQVVESAKHWDGAETIGIPVLAKEKAKALVVQAG